MIRRSIYTETLKGIADAVRHRTGAVGTLSPEDMADELNGHYFLQYDESMYPLLAKEWTRPEGWPDLDSLPMDTESTSDLIYMTYDADQEHAAVAWHIDTLNSSQATIDIGHIENGAFVVDDTTDVGNNTNYIKDLEEFSGKVVVRISGTITHCYGISRTFANGAVQNHRQQPMLERVGHIPNLTYLTPHATNNSWGMWLLERDKLSNNGGAALTNMSYGWSDCKRLQVLDLTGFDTPEVTNMSYAFSNCYCLGALNIGHWDVRKVQNFSYTFSSCISLKSLDLRTWETDAATNMSYMFSSCSEIEEIKGIETLNTALVTNMSYMFSGIHRIKKFDLHAWTVTAVTNTSYMFNSCRGVWEIDLHGWKATALTNPSYMFINCHSAKIINLTGFETGNVTTLAGMFNFCYSVQKLNIQGIKVTASCTNIYIMFSGCWSLKRLDFPEWTLTGLGNGNNTANSMFLNCYSLEYITGIKDWQFNFTNSLGSFFQNCQSLRELDVSGWKVNTITSFGSMFAGCWNLRSLNLTNWNPANCTSFANMFNDCRSLKTVGDLSGWTTSKVTNLSTMFNSCIALAVDPKISNWDVQKVTTCASMFQSCRGLEEITITGWTLSACTTVATMFRYCYNLRKAKLTGWSLPKLTSTAPAQFLGDCPNLEDVDPPSFPLNHSYAGDSALSHAALIKILAALPTVGTKRTLNLTATNLSRLTAAEKAVGTGKNWTLAN